MEHGAFHRPVSMGGFFVMDKSFVRTRALSRRFASGKAVATALNGVDLEVRHGEFVALVGSSGSGKSTLLNLLGGLDRPSEGEVWVEDLSLGKASDSELVSYRRGRVGFIFQSFNLLPTLSAAENVVAPMMLAEVSKRERDARAFELLESVGLSARAEHKPTELSGGEKQRVAIARALANKPNLLLADEPTGNLDSRTGAGVLDLLCALLRERQMTMVMVTHDMGVAARADRIVHLRDGRIEKIENQNGGSAA
jgi:putative ABC transport system ATP-binding protein